MFNFKKRYAKTADHARSGSTKKFGNVKQSYDGISFDSKIEVSIYKEMKIMQSEGLFKDIIAHPPAIEIYPSTKHILSNGEAYLFRECRYYPDMLLVANDGTEFVIDIKSFATLTADAILKFKMLYHVLGIYIIIITKESWKGESSVIEILNGTYFSAMSKNKLISRAKKKEKEG